VGKVQATEQVLRGVMDRWKAGIDAHEPERVAEVFAEDAIFQGLRPYSVGRQGVDDYYASRPLGMTVTYRILETRQPTADLVLGYLHVVFSYLDREPVSLNLGVLVSRSGDTWSISHYQVSPAT